MNDRQRFEEEIERRLNDSLWEKRMHRSVTNRLQAEKRRRLGIAAAALFSVSLAIGGYSMTDRGQASLASLNHLLTGAATPEEEISSQQYLQWNGFGKFPLQEDEELSIVLGNVYYE